MKETALQHISSVVIFMRRGCFHAQLQGKMVSNSIRINRQTICKQVNTYLRQKRVMIYGKYYKRNWLITYCFFSEEGACILTT